MKFKLVTSCLALMLFVTVSAEGQGFRTLGSLKGRGGKLLSPTAKWNGIVKNTALLTLAPKGGLITDAKTFSKLCLTWVPGSTVPTVDFTKEIVLVGTIQGPNHATMNALLDNKGNVVTSTGITKRARSKLGAIKRGGAGFGYAIMTVSRAKIKTVNGVAVPKGLIGTVGKQKNFVKVTVRGDLTTGVIAIGRGKTTGILISANGITYELDFGTNITLKNQVNKLDGKKVLMNGTLTLLGKRRIVTVETIYLVK